MSADEFLKRVFEIAHEMGFKPVEMRRHGMSIGFNPKSKKWIHEGHLRALFPNIRVFGLSVTQLNCEIQKVAPGRPCTHVGMRAIIERLHSEGRGFSVLET